MTTVTSDTPDAERYRLFLLRLWRDNDGPWHASLQAADAATPHRFADLEALIGFLRTLVPAGTAPSAAPASAATTIKEPDGSGS